MARYAMPAFQVLVFDEDDGFPIRIVATVTENNRPSAGISIIFSIDGKNIEDTLVTDGGGQVDYDCIVSEGKHYFKAWIAEDPSIFRKEDKSLKRSAPKTPTSRIPDNVDVAALGGNGQFTVMVTVLDKDGKPCKDIFVKIIDEKTGSVEFQGNTDSRGLAEHHLAFRDQQRRYKIWVGQFVSSKNPQQLVLVGPDNTNKIPPLRLSPAEQPRSLFEAVRIGLERGIQDLKKEAADATSTQSARDSKKSEE